MEAISLSRQPLALVGARDIDLMIARARTTPPGAFVEVGVYHGGSAWHLSELAIDQGRPLFLYDTFEGIPYQGPLDGHAVGEMKGDYAEVCAWFPFAHVTKGVFPGSALSYMPKVAFAHLDCDQYQSVKESALYLERLMLPGGVIWFDDSPHLKGARTAVEQLYPPSRLKLSYEEGERVGKHYVEF